MKLSKAEAVVGIFIAPVPLVAGHLDGHVALGDFLLLEQHRQREGPDEHQDQDRHDVQATSSGELWVKLAGFGLALAVVAHDHE